MADFIAGRFYRTRKGEKVAYMGSNPFPGVDHVHVFAEQDGDIFSTDGSGAYDAEQGECRLDIVGEWQEQVIATWWAFTVLTKGGASFLSSFLSKENAETSRNIEIKSGSRVSDIEEIVTVVP
jgi:hypothetical protein